MIFLIVFIDRVVISLTREVWKLWEGPSTSTVVGSVDTVTVELTQAPAYVHAVLLRVEIVAVAAAASVDEAHALPLACVEDPARHGGAAGASLSLQRANGCRGTAVRASRQQGQHLALLPATAIVCYSLLSLGYQFKLDT